MAKTNIVIPNWNGAKVIDACLDSINFDETRVIVVDNASADNSVALIREKYPAVDLIELPKNRGFAGGVNAGIKLAMDGDAKYIALLNNDAVAGKEWLKTLENFLDKHPKAGIATPKILDRAGKRIDSSGDQY